MPKHREKIKEITEENRWLLTRKEMIAFFAPQSWATIHSRMLSPTCPKEKISVGWNQYDVRAYVRWLEKFLSQENTSAEMAKEKLRHEKYKADKAMYEASERANKLLSRDIVIADISSVISGTKAKFLSWISRLPPLFVNKNTAEIENLLQKELYTILYDLAKGLRAVVPEEKTQEEDNEG